jgi:hypothetical protein
MRAAGARTPRIGPLDPLYLFACAVQWNKESDAVAGWELLSALDSSDPSTRILAHSLIRDETE